MTTNESRIYGTLLTLASLMVIALVVMGAPEREKVKCEGYNLSFKIEEKRDTFLIGERVTIVNETNNVRSLKWIVSDKDSVDVGKSMQEQSLILIFTREGEKKIQLQINDNEECTTIAKRIFIMPHCSDKQRNGSETDIDCGGNCPPCEPETPVANNTRPRVSKPTCYDGKKNGSETGIDCGGSCPRRCKANIGSLPQAYIVRIAGELKCDTDITFDCGIPPEYNPTWSFADTGKKNFPGRRVTHKFRNEGTYVIRVYINNTQVGQKRFDIAPCSGGTPVVSDPLPPEPIPTASIILPNRLTCKEMLTFRSSGAQSGSRLRWQVDGTEQTGTNLYHTFNQAGTYTVKLYVNSNYAPDDTRTFKVNCDNTPPPPPPPASDIKTYGILKTKLQDITDTSAKAFTLVTKRGARYQQILGDPSLCEGGATIVKINNDTEKSLDAYFDQIIKKQYVIDQVRIKKNGSCIEKILINHHRK